MTGIYKITNKINGKVYIGQSGDIHERWLEHKRINERQNAAAKIAQTYPLYRAFKKYGLDNFLFEVIEECPLEELDKKEIFWIDYYNSYVYSENSNGYNLTLGGGGNQKITEQQITKIISLWQEGKSTGDIMKEMDIERHAIIKYLKLFCPSYSTKEGDKRGRINNGKSHQKPIKQYDLLGNFIREYSSIRNAAKELQISVGAISANAKYRSRTCKNSYFIYSSDNQEEGLLKHQNMKGNGKAVMQLDSNNNILNIFPNASVAAKKLGKPNGDNILHCCQGRTKSAYGYYWKYV